ncbi:unnamed protein product [Protopolystoma xenopodis]|uniref:Uncharacterized protein n=1 Tax=Protopolystoma xenopodis TaxID=117903 RepID=A0A3S5AAS1_9PLAT|nr:unnamed protein product [Protopolystoma xenopodis]
MHLLFPKAGDLQACFQTLDRMLGLHMSPTSNPITKSQFSALERDANKKLFNSARNEWGLVAETKKRETLAPVRPDSYTLAAALSAVSSSLVRESILSYQESE